MATSYNDPNLVVIFTRQASITSGSIDYVIIINLETDSSVKNLLFSNNIALNKAVSINKYYDPVNGVYAVHSGYYSDSHFVIRKSYFDNSITLESQIIKIEENYNIHVLDFVDLGNNELSVFGAGYENIVPELNQVKIDLLVFYMYKNIYRSLRTGGNVQIKSVSVTLTPNGT